MSLASARRADAKGNRIIQGALETGPIATGANQVAVKWAERMLQIAGFDPGVRDNKFTAKTAEAFKQFQGARGIPVTGELDARTFAHLKAVEKFVRGHNNKTFSVGQKDAFIQSAESRLKKLGYDTGKADGIFDRQTAKAMEGFKRDQKDLGKNSMLGEKSGKELARETRRLAHDPTRARKTQGLKTHRRLDAATAKAAASERPVGSGFGVGDQGRAVKNAQAHLRAAGFDPKRTDGKFDERTEGALQAFQRRSGLQPTGRVDEKTWAKLNGAIMLAKDATSPAQRLGERSAAVKRTEKLLKGAGMKGVKVDGLYDKATANAVARFKRARHLGGNPQAVGAGTLQALKKAQQASTKTVKGCAQALLRSKNVSFWSGLSTGSDRKALVALAAGKKAYVPATGRYVMPKLKMMQALVEMSKKGRIMINALTGGSHSVGSNHYSGTAVDLEVTVGSPGQIAAIARKYGGYRNSETSHIHLDF